MVQSPLSTIKKKNEVILSIFRWDLHGTKQVSIVQNGHSHSNSAETPQDKCILKSLLNTNQGCLQKNFHSLRHSILFFSFLYIYVSLFILFCGGSGGGRVTTNLVKKQKRAVHEGYNAHKQEPQDPMKERQKHSPWYKGVSPCKTRKRGKTQTLLWWTTIHKLPSHQNFTSKSASLVSLNTWINPTKIILSKPCNLNKHKA